MKQIVLVVHNVRSAHNTGSMLRTADGLGVNKVYLSGYTPYPARPPDERLPHVADKVNRQIAKTALGAEDSVDWEAVTDIEELIDRLTGDGFTVAALEQSPAAVDLKLYNPPNKIALIVGNEVEGIEKTVLDRLSVHLQIPMSGRKESFNVAVAAAIALYSLSRLDKVNA